MAQVWQESAVRWKCFPHISAEHSESSPPKMFPFQELWTSEVESESTNDRAGTVSKCNPLINPNNKYLVQKPFKIMLS